MFEHLDLLPPDPILGLGQQFAADPNPEKIGLSVGVFVDETGNTPVLASVRKAEARVLKDQQSKAYIAQAGDPGFLDGMARLLLGAELAGTAQDRIALVQGAGGCGALRIAAEVAKAAAPEATIWVSDPTWANHYPLLEAAGFTLKAYPYYNAASSEIEFDRMLEGLRAARAGDLVLLHASCHNPTGADLTPSQWDELLVHLAERELVPFIDSAYQGFARGIEEDAYGIRASVERLPNVLVAASCSKNFGLYRERTGVMLFAGRNREEAAAARSHALALARRSFTMAPYHGGGIVGAILADPELEALWRSEVDAMRGHITGMRSALTKALEERQVDRDFRFIAAQHGMFSLLGIDEAAVTRLKEQHAVYVLKSSRMNAAGLSAENVPSVADAIAEVLRSQR